MPEWLEAALAFAAHALLMPIRGPLERLGFAPTDIGIYSFLVGLLLLCMALSFGRGLWLFRRERRGQAVGTVVAIDRRGEDPTPIIRFKDASGRAWEFDSGIPLDARTQQVGASVAVSYDLGNPSVAFEDGRTLYRVVCALALLVFAGVVFGFSFGLIGP